MKMEIEWDYKALKHLKNDLELEDEFYRNSKSRQNDGWKIHSYVMRNISLSIGILSVKLTKYYKKINGKTQTWVWKNSFLEENKYQRVGITIKRISNSLHNQGHSSSSVSEHLKAAYGVKISPRSTWNYARNFTNIEVKEDYKELAKDKKYVYVEADDSYNGIRNINKTVSDNRFRMVAFHLGKNEYRNVIGKIINLEIRDITDKNRLDTLGWANYVKTEIREIYGKDLEMIVVGDGASWIRKLSENLGCKYILDMFHIKKKGFETLGYNEKKNKKNKLVFEDLEQELGFSFWKTFSGFVDNYQFQKAILFLNNVYESFPEMNKESRDKIRQLKNYLKNNIVSDDVYDSQKGYIGSNTETFISHYIAKNVRKNKATFGYKRIEKMLINKSNENLQYRFI